MISDLQLEQQEERLLSELRDIKVVSAFFVLARTSLSIEKAI